MNIAVLASGSGTNFEAIAKSIKKGYIKARLKLLVTDKRSAFVRERARRFKVKDVFINPRDFKRRLDFDKEVVRLLKKEKIGLVVLAGFMRMITPFFVRAFKNKILNIHPALLPAFKGLDGIGDAYRYGAKVTGVTVHFVDDEMDHGPVVLQQAVEIKEDDDLGSLEERIHKAEHKIYPKAVKLFTESRLKVSKRRVRILG